MKRLLSLALASAVLCGSADSAFAWGSTGHRMIGQAAIEALPEDVPAFVRAESSAVAVGELSREPDRLRGAGKAFDADRSPAHFVDGGDDGKVAGALMLAALPPTRDDYEAALRAAGTSSWKMGYLPYSIIEDWQQLARDFAYWRVDHAAARYTTDDHHRVWFEADQERREGQILVDIGQLSHFVGDGSMPLHASIHFNGWGAFPNPAGYTQEKVHVPWEGLYVRQVVDYQAMKAKMPAFSDCGCPIEQRVGAYLAADLATVVPFYELEKAGAFKAADRKGVDFTTARVAAGAAELRDEIVLAWRASREAKIGYQPEVSVTDVEAGKLDPYDSVYGAD
jgi:hypothetical protein